MSDMPIVSPFVPWVPTPNRKRRHVLDLDDFSAAEIIDVLDAATSMKEVLGCRFCGGAPWSMCFMKKAPAPACRLSWRPAPCRPQP